MGWSYGFRIDTSKPETLAEQIKTGLADAIAKAEAEGAKLDACAKDEETKQIALAASAAAILAQGVGGGFAHVTITGHANPEHKRPDPDPNNRRYAEGDTITVVVTR